MSSVNENCFIVTVEFSALHGGMMTSWFITEMAENMNTATENSVAEMNIFHCHHISGFYFDFDYTGHGQQPVHSQALWSNFLIYEATEWEAFININAYFIKLMHIKPAL